jgi:hypothetical protein
MLRQCGRRQACQRAALSSSFDRTWAAFMLLAGAAASAWRHRAALNRELSAKAEFSTQSISAGFA